MSNLGHPTLKAVHLPTVLILLNAIEKYTNYNSLTILHGKKTSHTCLRVLSPVGKNVIHTFIIRKLKQNHNKGM